ncbi:PREDICTED: interferon-induced, double-stranded RNA-activated protein kinase [Pterocles gutturalis]|uniref:interferon-induced, double-stranded RNA-activated protein kinase n=1 Tax=Pterocles gutturalis TaxID=240206 RepID=UPI000529503E|nr:PREDICTED: interferon-induced, double-stranded RNA-activated protein kinase [Pterocles gutturalis]
MEREYMEKLNNYCLKNKFHLVYADFTSTVPRSNPEFTFVVKINGKEYGTGIGKNKKDAKAVAAKKTWEIIEKQTESPSNMQAAEPMPTPATLSPALDNNYIGRLNTYSQKTRETVDYSTKCTGEAHAPRFSCSCIISGFVYGIGTGPSQATAKQAAAKEAYEKLCKEGTITEGSEKSNTNSTSREHVHCSEVPTQSDFNNSSIFFKDSAGGLVEKVKDMAICEKPSPSQRHAQSSALKPQRKLAANFANARSKEEKKNMPDSDEDLTNLDTNTSEENENPYTVNKRFLESFKNIEPIGEGGFGNVFKATAKIDERTYAIKRVPFTKNVKREVTELARLEHENIVRYYFSWKGCDRYPGSRQKADKEVLYLFIQMELCERGTLENWIDNRQDRKDHKMAQNKFLQILKGMEYIHSKELIHRDLKPQNIFISREDKVKIGDFGLVTSAAYETLTENRGTKSYMAPEQVRNDYGKEVDIYALGLIWFEILSAFTRHEKMKVWSDVREGKLPKSFTNEFPTEEPIIKKMLSRDPSVRYSASEILNFLKSVDRGNTHKACSY